MNIVMERGKKSLAEQIFYHALEFSRRTLEGRRPGRIQARARQRPPAVEVRSRRVGGANYQVQVKCVRRAQSLAMRWLVTRRAGAARSDGRAACSRKSSTLPPIAAARSKSAKTHIEWRMPTGVRHYRW